MVIALKFAKAVNIAIFDWVNELMYELLYKIDCFGKSKGVGVG